MSADEVSECAEDGLANHDCEYEDEDWLPELNERLDLDHHADGDEEDGSEVVLEGERDVLNLVGLKRLGEYRTHDERAEGGAEAEFVGEERHAHEEGGGDDEEHLVVHHLADKPEECGEDKETDDERHGDEDAESGDGAEDFAHVAHALGCGREHYEENDSDYILEDEHAHDLCGEAFAAESEVFERLVDDGCAAHGEHSSEEDAVHF